MEMIAPTLRSSGLWHICGRRRQQDVKQVGQECCTTNQSSSVQRLPRGIVTEHRVYEKALDLAWRYAEVGVEGIKCGHTLVLGNPAAIMRCGHIAGGDMCDDYMGGQRKLSIMDSVGQQHVLSQMNHDGMIIIRSSDGTVMHNRFFAAEISKEVDWGGARKRSSAWIAEKTRSDVLMVSHDSTGEVNVFRGSGQCTSMRRPVAQGVYKRLTADLLPMIDLDVLTGACSKFLSDNVYDDAWLKDGGDGKDFCGKLTKRIKGPGVIRQDEAGCALSLQDLLTLCTKGDARSFGIGSLKKLVEHLKSKVHEEVCLMYGAEDGVVLSTRAEHKTVISKLHDDARVLENVTLGGIVIRKGSRVRKARVDEGEWQDICKKQQLEQLHFERSMRLDIDQLVEGIPPPKTAERACEKATIKYGGDHSRLVDLNRATLRVPSVRVAYDCVGEMLNVGEAPKIHKLQALQLQVLRVDDHMKKPMPQGYRHIQCIVRFQGTIWELQVITTNILQRKFEVGHKRYKTTRYVAEQVLLNAIRGSMADLEDLLKVPGVSELGIITCQTRKERILTSAFDGMGLQCLHHAAFRGDAAMVSLLLKHKADTLRRDNNKHRRMPINIAKEHGRTDVFHLLVKAMMQSGEEHRIAALQTLGGNRLLDGEHETAVVDLLKDESPMVRKEAIAALRRLGALNSHDDLPEERVAKRLCGLLRDENVDVQRAAIAALGDLGKAARTHIDLLVATLSDARLRLDGLRALRSIGLAWDHVDTVLDCLRRGGAKDKQIKDIHCAAAELLCKMESAHTACFHAVSDWWDIRRNVINHACADAVHVLYRMGCPLGGVDTQHRTALHYAAASGRDDMLLALKDFPWPQEVCTRAMHEAAGRGHAKALEVLVQTFNESPDKRDQYCRTSFHTAAFAGQSSVLKALSALRCDPGAQDTDGRTAVHSAASNGHSDALRVLKRLGCDVNARDNEGQTPLFVAASHGQSKVAELLKELGADVMVRDSHGVSVVEAARRSKNRRTWSLLKEMGCCDDDESDGRPSQFSMSPTMSPSSSMHDFTQVNSLSMRSLPATLETSSRDGFSESGAEIGVEVEMSGFS